MTAQKTCPVAGLVGGVGSGKSAVARRAAERYGFAVVDGDATGHRALADAAVKAKIRERFGPGVFAADGTIDRRTLGHAVFGGTAGHAAAKADLERITHPVIRREFEREIAEARDADAPAVLLDAAVLLEAGWRGLCDAVVYVDTSDDRRRDRAAARSGWSEAEWRRREASQLPLDEKRRRADATVPNDGPLDDAADALAAAVARLLHVRLPDPVGAPA